jgi:hypothetical protein
MLREMVRVRRAADDPVFIGGTLANAEKLLYNPNSWTF